METDRKALTTRAGKILRALRRTYPQARCELIYENPLQLAIACILSAQCTDKRVNQVTPALFARYRTAADWAAIPPPVLEEAIHSTGFYRNKAKNIIGFCQQLVEHFDGHVPNDFDALVKLPGIGRKTANVIMVSAFDTPGIVVDTHMIRLSNRLGLTRQRDPVKIEFELREILPRPHWGHFSHAIVFHGRRCCTARKPDCARCEVRRWCPSKDEFKD